MLPAALVAQILLDIAVAEPAATAASPAKAAGAAAESVVVSWSFALISYLATIDVGFSVAFEPTPTAVEPTAALGRAGGSLDSLDSVDSGDGGGGGGRAREVTSRARARVKATLRAGVRAIVRWFAQGPVGVPFPQT